MGIFRSKIDTVIDPSMNKIIELKRIQKTLDISIDNNNISRSGKLQDKDKFTYLIINDKLQCIIPENAIEYSDVGIVELALDSLNENECLDEENEISYKDYETIKYIQKLYDKIKMTSNNNNKIVIFEKFTI